MTFVKQACRIFRSTSRKRRSVIVLVVMGCIYVATQVISTDKTKTLSSDCQIFGAVLNGGSQKVRSPLEDRQRKRSRLAVGKETAGKLNLHVWKVCSAKVNSLKQWPLFPCFPDRKAFVTDGFTIEVLENDIGQQAFGFLFPKSTGTFHFAIASDYTSELWLSTNEDPRKARLIAQAHHNGLACTKPGGIMLKSGKKYYIESLHKNGQDIGHVSVLWKPPGADQFNIITEQFLYPYCVDSSEQRCPCFDNEEPLPSHMKPSPPQPLSEETFEHYYNTPAFSQSHLKDVLTAVPYEPSYVVRDGKVKKDEGIRLVGFHLTSVYPKDTVFLNSGSSPGGFNGPNEILSKTLAEQIVRQFMVAFERQHRKRFSLEKIIRVEGKADTKTGHHRFLLDLKLYDTVQRKTLRLAEYVSEDPAGHLGFPNGFKWRRNAKVYFILPVKNQANWLIFFVNEMTKLYLRTKDENFHIVVVDFQSTDGDISNILKNSRLAQKYTLLMKSGPFYKTSAIQDAVKTIPHPDGIVFLIDLHITLPLTLLDSIRKHTIQNKTVFLPVSARLDCGKSPSNPSGFWALEGSGVVAVYKSDWERFHGVNVEEYTTKWGGEDWDLLDRMLRVGLESERLKIQGFCHFYHTRENMWENATSDTPVIHS